MEITISKSDKKDKKFKAIVKDKDKKKTIHFGQAGASDMTQHKSEDRKKRYISRHKKNEDWTKSGIDTAGFYSKHLLWNKDTMDKSFSNLKKRFPSINFIYK